MSEAPTYYEQWGPVARRMRRASDRARFFAKKSLGLRPSILVELKWRLGDEIMALPIFCALRAAYPQARIEVLTHYPDLFIDHPHVNAVNPEAPAPDRYYLLRGAPPDAFRLAHYARQAEVAVPVERPRLYYEDWTSPLLGDLPEGDGPLIALAPGASWTTKRWPVPAWRALVAFLDDAGCRVFELGNANEGVGIPCSLLGKTSVRDAAVLLHHADVAVTNDSGLMHLARAAGTPAVGLFGPTDPAILIRDDAGFHPLTNGRECAGCWNGGEMETPGVCPREVASCMETLEPERVAREVLNLCEPG